MILVMTAALSALKLGYVVAADNQFTLVEGRHVEVCEAYVARLNATKFEHPPFCDRPENTSVPGFALLRRVLLTPAEAFKLWPSVGAMEKPASNTEDWALPAAMRETDETILAWKYDPEVDIQNNGSMQSVIIWRGSRMNFGVATSDFACGMQWDRETPQLAFILNAARSQVDVATTKRVFWRSKPAILSYTVGGKSYQTSIDLSIGKHMGIFRFKDLYYFDTFYDNDKWGDYQNKRRKAKSLENTLGVFLNRNGETREMCELRLN
jgi:hypothetical protein